LITSHDHYDKQHHHACVALLRVQDSDAVIALLLSATPLPCCKSTPRLWNTKLLDICCLFT
jgi:hypothetical protein